MHTKNTSHRACKSNSSNMHTKNTTDYIYRFGCTIGILLVYKQKGEDGIYFSHHACKNSSMHTKNRSHHACKNNIMHTKNTTDYIYRFGCTQEYYLSTSRMVRTESISHIMHVTYLYLNCILTSLIWASGLLHSPMQLPLPSVSLSHKCDSY